MEIEQVKIGAITPYSKNNKEHGEIQINRIMNSIKEFWFTQPIVLDKNNIIIIGHWRYEAAKKLWLTEIPCLRMEKLTEKQVKKLRILDNKLNESEWDLENLKLELDELEDLNFGDLEFSTEDLFPEFDAPDFSPDDYDLWEHKKDWKIQVIVEAQDEDEAEVIKNDIEGLGRKCFIK